MDDDASPRPRGDAASLLATEDLGPYSQDELKARIALLEAEIVRVRNIAFLPLHIAMRRRPCSDARISCAMRGLKSSARVPISPAYTALANLRPIGCPVLAFCESQAKDF